MSAATLGTHLSCSRCAVVGLDSRLVCVLRCFAALSGFILSRVQSSVLFQQTMSNGTGGTTETVLSWKNVDYRVGKDHWKVRWNPLRVTREKNVRRILNNGMKQKCRAEFPLN